MVFFRRREPVTENPQKEIYRWVNALDLTLGELRASRLPDKTMHAIWAEFTSPAEKHYQAIHVPAHPDGPYILFCGLDKDIPDFGHVEQLVARGTRGKPRGHTIDRETDICDIIQIRERRLTQLRVADFIEGYIAYFKDVKIPFSYFMNVPRSVYENSGLPPGKLSFEPYSKHGPTIE